MPYLCTVKLKKVITMKLFRQHSQEFQKEIENSNNLFVLDKSRRFNHTGRNKNVAKLFFYALDEVSTNAYKNEDTQLFTYESDAKLLDLRDENNRKLLVNTITNIIKYQLNSINSCIDDLLKSIEIYQKERGKKRKIKMLQQQIENFKEYNLTEEEVVKNINHFSGCNFWGQNISDYENGLLIKKEVEELGYEGFIFKDQSRNEVALFKPAKQID